MHVKRAYTQAGCDGHLKSTINYGDGAGLKARIVAHFRFDRVNLAEPASAQQVVQRCQDTFAGKIDSLLNIAGVMDTNDSVNSMSEANWDKILAINLTAPALLSKYVTKVFLKQRSGSIVNISSKAGTSGAAAGAAYTVSKHGIVGLTKNIAWRFHNEGIRCNAICPGGVATNITKSIDVSKIDKEATKLIEPVVRLHQDGFMNNAAAPNCISNLMAFLVSDAASGINGAIIPADNAWSCI
ncbi:uncharacterized protein Z518_03512 [Rhinocladiella mackenziei CBS 650.93]|uniref:Uncharacterized protein n=1 Tax=Rhinocladiella mackenziei CBS 650.93 TaxID=1442369 RepID=A0A0D2JHN5_9EURO|nr:uncharacterized protein Z518_03512 [Rhinocladiella mackenziei CBS 650.93]KIX08855.1 hypothetical protein Z518_03512 [Rhinocladiella mackenziei CBS 650.93]